jgi:hypothetical protein
MKLNVGFLFLVFFLIVTCATFENQTNQRGVKRTTAEFTNNKAPVMYLVRKR